MSNNDPILSELIKAANHLLGTFEPGLLWDWLSDQLKNRPPSEDKDGNNKLFVPSSPPEFEEILSLTDFLLEIVSFVSFISRKTQSVPPARKDTWLSVSFYCAIL